MPATLERRTAVERHANIARCLPPTGSSIAGSYAHRWSSAEASLRVESQLGDAARRAADPRVSGRNLGGLLRRSRTTEDLCPRARKNGFAATLPQTAASAARVLPSRRAGTAETFFHRRHMTLTK